MANTEIVENDAARTRGGATIEMSAKNAGASVPIDADRMKCISDGHPEVGRVGERDEHEPVDHADDRDEPQEEAGVAHGDLGDARHGDEHADDLEGFDAGGDEPTARAVDVEHLLVDEGEELRPRRRARPPRKGTAHQIRRMVRTW